MTAEIASDRDRSRSGALLRYFQERLVAERLRTFRCRRQGSRVRIGRMQRSVRGCTFTERIRVFASSRPVSNRCRCPRPLQGRTTRLSLRLPKTRRTGSLRENQLRSGRQRLKTRTRVLRFSADDKAETAKCQIVVKDSRPAIGTNVRCTRVGGRRRYEALDLSQKRLSQDRPGTSTMGPRLREFSLRVPR